MKRSIFYAIVFFASFGMALGQSLQEVTLYQASKAKIQSFASIGQGKIFLHKSWKMKQTFGRFRSF